MWLYIDHSNDHVACVASVPIRAPSVVDFAPAPLFARPKYEKVRSRGPISLGSYGNATQNSHCLRTKIPHNLYWRLWQWLSSRQGTRYEEGRLPFTKILFNKMCQLIYLFKVALALYLFHKLVCYVTCYNFAIWGQHHGHTKCIVASINTWKETSRQKQLPWLSHSNPENKQYGTEVERNTRWSRNECFEDAWRLSWETTSHLAVRPPRAIFWANHRKRSRMGVVRVQTLKIDGC